MNLDKRLLAELRPIRGMLALAIGLDVLAGILLVGQAYALSQTVSRVFLDGQGVVDVQHLLILLAIIAVVRALVLWGSSIAGQHIAGHVKADLRARLAAHLFSLGPQAARGERTGELVNTATEGIEALDAYLSQYIPQLALAALVPLTMLVIIFPVDVLSAVVLLLTAPLIPFFMILIGELANAQSQKQWQQLSRLSAHFLDTLQGLTTLKLFGRSRAQIAVIAQISDEFRDATLRVLRIAFLSALALEMLSTLSTAIIAVEIGLRLLYARMAFDDALFILILAPEYYLPLRNLGASFHAGVTGVTAAGRVFEVLATPVGGPPPHLPPVGTPSPSGRGGNLSRSEPLTITFENVHYAYADGDRPALNGVSFTIQPGQHVGLAGRSGSGKSTVMQLLLRFIEPTAGRILVNGRDLRTLPVAVWRAQIAWVPQMPYLLAESVADNIRLGRPDAPLDDVIHAAQLAHADEFIRALPDGYATPIGERGARLSGGQAQRVALARAFLQDAPLLLLDEATANLDPATETLITASLDRLMEGCTALVIAHRLVTLTKVSPIIVLDHGMIGEIGPFAELSWGQGGFDDIIKAAGVSLG